MSELNTEICYVAGCANPAGTVEHAPPRVFFPEQKDVGVNYRERLVTVPACEQHNTAFSKDDEYVAFIMHSHISTNKAAQKNFDTKILRAMERNRKLIDRFYKNAHFVWVLENGKYKRVARFDIDKTRVDRVLKRIASALYYKLQNRRISIDSQRYFVYSPDTVGRNLQPDTPQEFEIATSKFRYTALPLWNEEIFVCDYHVDPQEEDRFIFRYTFYGSFRYRVIH